MVRLAVMHILWLLKFSKVALGACSTEIWHAVLACEGSELESAEGVRWKKIALRGSPLHQARQLFVPFELAVASPRLLGLQYSLLLLQSIS